jgi:hypothetical protein
VEDYYVGGTEAPGYRVGSGSLQARARGEVEPDALHAVLAGRDPASSVPPVGGHSRRIPGFDVTFSAPSR